MNKKSVYKRIKIEMNMKIVIEYREGVVRHAWDTAQSERII